MISIRLVVGVPTTGLATHGRTRNHVREGSTRVFLRIWRRFAMQLSSNPSQNPAAGTRSTDQLREMGEAPIERLLELIAQGNRDAAAVLVTKYEPMIRRRIRARLGGETRRLFDSQDVFSTVCRRFDRFVDGKRVRAATPGDLLSLLSRIAQTSVLDKQRMVSRLDRLEGEDSEFARLVRGRVDHAWKDPSAFEVDINRWSSLLDSPQDRTILFRHMAGRSLEQVARELGITPELARKRWQLIRARLRKELTSGSSP